MYTTSSGLQIAYLSGSYDGKEYRKGREEGRLVGDVVVMSWQNGSTGSLYKQ